MQYSLSKAILLHPAAGENRHLPTYHWPGNVRELENILERLFVTGAGSVIRGTGELFDILPALADEQPTSAFTLPSGNIKLEPLSQALARTECELLQSAKQQCKTTYEMAEVLGISQPSVVRKLRKHML